MVACRSGSAAEGGQVCPSLAGRPPTRACTLAAPGRRQRAGPGRRSPCETGADLPSLCRGSAPACDHPLELPDGLHATDPDTPFRVGVSTPSDNPDRWLYRKRVWSVGGGRRAWSAVREPAHARRPARARHRPAPHERQDPARRPLRSPGPGLHEPPAAVAHWRMEPLLPARSSAGPSDWVRPATERAMALRRNELGADSLPIRYLEIR